MSYPTDPNNPAPADWPLPQSPLLHFQVLLDFRDYSQYASEHPDEEVQELAKLMNLHGRVPRLTGCEMCNSINDLMKNLLLTGTRKHPASCFEKIRKALSREYPKEALQSVESYLARAADQLSTVADACSRLQLKDATERLDGHSFHALVSTHARIHKTSVGDILRVPLDEFADALVNWPTAECSVATLQKLHEFCAEKDQMAGRITCRSRPVGGY